MWEKVAEKIDDAKAKVNLQLSFYIREIDSKYPKSHCLSTNKDKKDTYWESHNKASNKDKDKATSHNSSSSANQP